MQTNPRVLFAVSALAACLALGLVAPGLAQESGGEPAAPPAPAAEQFTFKLRVKPGQRFGFRQTVAMDQQLRTPSGDMPTKLRQTTEQVWEVLKVADDGAADVKVEVRSVKGSMENPMMGDVEFDSTRPDKKSGNPMTDMMVDMFTMLAGKSFEVTLDGAGALKEIRGLREVMEEALARSPLAAMGGDLDAMLDDDALRQQMAGLFPPGVTGVAVAVGHTWQVVTKMPLQGVGVVETTADHRLASVTAESATIATKLDMKFLGGGQVPAELKSAKGHGEMRVSLADGLPSSSRTVMDMTFGMETEMGEMSMVMHGDTQVARFPAPPATPAGKSEGTEGE